MGCGAHGGAGGSEPRSRGLVPCGTCRFLFSLRPFPDPLQRGGEAGAQRLANAEVPPPPASPGALSRELPPLGSPRSPFMEGRTPWTPVRKPWGGGSQQGVEGWAGGYQRSGAGGAPGRPCSCPLPASPCPPSRPQLEHMSPCTLSLQWPPPHPQDNPKSSLCSPLPRQPCRFSGHRSLLCTCMGTLSPDLRNTAEVTGL